MSDTCILLETKPLFIHQLWAAPRARRSYELKNEEGKLVGRANEEISPKRRLLPRIGRPSPRPFLVELLNEKAQLLLTLERQISFRQDRMRVTNPQGELLGNIQLRLPLWGDKCMRVENPQGVLLARMMAKNFREPCLIDDPRGNRLGELTQQWAGLGRELLGNDDDYLLHWAEETEPQANTKRLVLAAALAFDLIFRDP
ncbi:MAG: hypothetical protein JRF33_12095 [Deltaproteobacteria bacterium]|nr:hypothetical protein [Deltaproteobacteria bacterium]